MRKDENGIVRLETGDKLDNGAIVISYVQRIRPCHYIVRQGFSIKHADTKEQAETIAAIEGGRVIEVND